MEGQRTYRCPVWRDRGRTVALFGRTVALFGRDRGRTVALFGRTVVLFGGTEDVPLPCLGERGRTVALFGGTEDVPLPCLEGQKPWVVTVDEAAAVSGAGHAVLVIAEHAPFVEVVQPVTGGAGDIRPEGGGEMMSSPVERQRADIPVNQAATGDVCPESEDTLQSGS